MDNPQKIITLDLEGVLLPEIWQQIALVTGVSSLGLTTRDIKNYDTLMELRIKALAKNNISFTDIQTIVARDITPLDGAVSFLRGLRAISDVIIISDTFSQFFDVLRPAFEYPVIFCNSLVIKNNMIEHHTQRLQNGKALTVKALQALNFVVASAGDSYNDIGMITQSNFGVFFNPPKSISEEYPKIPTITNYADLTKVFFKFLHKTS